VTFCALLFQNPEEVLDGHKIYPKTDCYFLLQGVTLHLEVGLQVLRMTHRLIIVSVCGKYLQNPLIYEKIWTHNKIYPETDCVHL
jgi:hypothetical protein